MDSRKVTIIEVAVYPPLEMGYININGITAFSGNYWDFHAECYGTIIGGFELSGKWISGMYALASAIGSEIEKTGVEVEIVRVNLTKDEYLKKLNTAA